MDTWLIWALVLYGCLVGIWLGHLAITAVWWLYLQLLWAIEDMWDA